LKLDPKKRVLADFSTGDVATSNLIEANLGVIARFGALSELRIAPRQTFEAGTEAQRSTALYDVRIAYSEAVDATAEKIRLKKDREGLQKAIESKEKQLGNETFRSRAPENIIKGLEATLAEQRIELRKLQDRLSQLERDS
jgi:valyl-tRNA synthetase